jgi:hypothetical protein
MQKFICKLLARRTIWKNKRFVYRIYTLSSYKLKDLYIRKTFTRFGFNEWLNDESIIINN